MSPSQELLSEGKAFWHEKESSASALVQLPNLHPIISQLDATIVNISTKMEPKDKKPEAGDRSQPQMPPSPENFFERFFGNPQPQPSRSMGSGFIISEDGYILTNNHVIDGADEVEVRVVTEPESENDQEVFQAEVVGKDPRTDVALLKIKPKKKLPFAYLGDSDSLKKGNWVMALGNPFGLDHSVSMGIVSALGREITASENRRFDNFIQTDAAINFGNSGGPLVNLKAEVVGINTAISAQGSGIGFAIPINLVKDILVQLKEKGSVSRGYLGVTIQDVNKDIQEALKLSVSEGVLVNDVVPDGPAAKSALKPGDVIIKVNKTKISDARSLQEVIAKLKPNSNANLEILREDKRLQLSIRLGALEDSSDQIPKPEAMADEDRLGLFVQPSPSGKNIEVVDLQPNSAAATAGMMPGDKLLFGQYQGKKFLFKTINDYKAFLKVLKKDESVLFSVQRDSGSGNNLQLFIAFRVP